MFRKIGLTMNPIMVKELRSRMRGPRPFITLTVMLILLSGITYGVYRIAITSLSSYSGSPISPQIGQSLFVMLAFLLLFVICILTPAVTAGAISSEREQLTYEILLATPLHPAKILWGKLFSSLSYIFLLIFSAIPIASLIFVFGGVTLREMVKSFIILIVVAITLGVFGIFMSTLLKRTSRATVITYVAIATILFGSIIFYVAVGVLQQGIPPRWIIAINPVSAMASALTNTSMQYNSVLSFIPIIGIDLNTLGGSSVNFNSIPRPLYHYSLPLYGFISIILYFISIRLVMPTKRWKLTHKDILIFLAVILMLCAIILGAFFSTTKNYEQATNNFFQDISGPIGAMRPPVIAQAVEVAAVEPPVDKIQKPLSSMSFDLSIDDQARVYALAIKEEVHQFEDTRKIEVVTIYIGETLTSEENGEKYNYSLPTSIQEMISKNIQSDFQKVEWVNIAEDVLKNPNLANQSSDLLILLGDIKIISEDTLNFPITIKMNDSEETQTLYNLKRQDDEWKIDSIEKVFDSASSN